MSENINDELISPQIAPNSTKNSNYKNKLNSEYENDGKVNYEDNALEKDMKFNEKAKLQKLNVNANIFRPKSKTDEKNSLKEENSNFNNTNNSSSSNTKNASNLNINNTQSAGNIKHYHLIENNKFGIIGGDTKVFQFHKQFQNFNYNVPGMPVNLVYLNQGTYYNNMINVEKPHINKHSLYLETNNEIDNKDLSKNKQNLNDETDLLIKQNNNTPCRVIDKIEFDIRKKSVEENSFVENEKKLIINNTNKNDGEKSKYSLFYNFFIRL